MKKEKFLKRCNAFYPKPLWNVGLKFYYEFLEQHKDLPVAQKLYDLMKQQEVQFEDKIVVFFDNTEIGMTWTKLVWELGKELIAADDEERRYIGVIHHGNIYASKMLMIAMDCYHSNSE